VASRFGHSLILEAIRGASRCGGFSYRLLGRNDVVDEHVEQIALGAIHKSLTEGELHGGLFANATLQAFHLYRSCWSLLSIPSRLSPP